MASDRAAELIKGFESKYPFVKVRFQPGGAGRQLEQLLVEHRLKSAARHYQHAPLLRKRDGKSGRDRALSDAATK